jgi:tRNA(Ile)-lysidine synthase
MPSAADRSNGLEAMWRSARHRFLRGTAAKWGAQIATAHTLDDQIETVLMRVLRGAGSRGLAGLAAAGTMVRPFLDVSRSTLERYARARGVSWVEDPSNARLDFLRNRVRHQLLPALRTADPALPNALLDIGRRAAVWRADVEALVDAAVPHRLSEPGTLVVAASELAGYDRDSLAVLWSALAARAGLVLDRRGTQRCAAFTMKRPRGGSIPISGGWRLEAVRGELTLHRRGECTVEEARLPDTGVVEWGRFRFSVGQPVAADERWMAELPESGPVKGRSWRAGDRLGPSRGQGRRRVSRYLAEAGIVGSVRTGWPVVVQGDEVVWIPGVRRSDAATVRPGRPGVRYECDRNDG